MGGWQPLLDGTDRQRTLAAVDAIVTDLAAIDLDPSLYYGHAGVALLHGYRARCGAADSLDAAAEHLGAAAEMFAEERAPWLAARARVTFCMASRAKRMATKGSPYITQAMVAAAAATMTEIQLASARLGRRRTPSRSACRT